MLYVSLDGEKWIAELKLKAANKKPGETDGVTRGRFITTVGLYITLKGHRIRMTSTNTSCWTEGLHVAGTTLDFLKRRRLRFALTRGTVMLLWSHLFLLQHLFFSLLHLLLLLLLFQLLLWLPLTLDFIFSQLFLIWRELEVR